ncbi:MAG: HDIG domain-containing protein [Candidatus Obscuribacterales bacterium]|nr:HDIG domain-containing protein [Candidatus Obscuribacterales bacterium]
MEAQSNQSKLNEAKTMVGWIGAALSGFVCLFLSLSTVHIFSPGLQENDVSDRDLIAPQATSVIDRSETEKSIEKARQNVIPVFQIDRSRDTETLAKIEAAFARAESLQALGLVPIAVKSENKAGASSHGNAKLRANSSHSPRTGVKKTGEASGAAKDFGYSEQLKYLQNQKQLPETDKSALKDELEKQKLAYERALKAGLIQDEELNLALSIKPDEMPSFKAETLTAARRLLSIFDRYPVTDKSVWQEVVQEFLPDKWPVTTRVTASRVINRYLEANLVIDSEGTKVKAQEAVKTVEPVMRPVKEGEVIVPQGALITKDKLYILQELGITHVNRWPFILSMAISLVAALTLVALFLYTYEPKHFFAPSSIGLMFTVQVVVASVASLVGKTNPQFVPIPAAALILTIFFGRRVAIALTLPMILLIAVDRLMDLHFIAAHLLATILAVFSYSSIGRSAVFKTGVLVAFGLIAGDMAACLVDHSISFDLATFGKRLPLDFAGGIVSSIVAVGSLPFLENLYGLITPFRLAELTDANQPLLRRLEENAPGTYQHSLAVANMAEAGAKAIYADANMVRAGALYHDIGKMVRPKYFIENQLGATNPHDNMAPEDSRARVLAHVTDGIALAQKYSLPKAIQDFIPMHQGTTLMAYFYHKACTKYGADKVDPNFYRYPGPKPNTKETAIVMLADVSEAVTHSMRDPSQEEVEAALEKVFQNRWDDGQFSDSGLSYEELHKVKAGFARVWRTLHHERLKYPSTTTGKMPIAPPLVKQENKEEIKQENIEEIKEDLDPCLADTTSFEPTGNSSIQPEQKPEQKIE